MSCYTLHEEVLASRQINAPWFVGLGFRGLGFVVQGRHREGVERLSLRLQPEQLTIPYGSSMLSCYTVPEMKTWLESSSLNLPKTPHPIVLRKPLLVDRAV